MSLVKTYEVDAELAPVTLGFRMFKLGNHGNHTIAV
jgi:hypothetical protein